MRYLRILSTWQSVMADVQERYGQMLEGEVQWDTKWKQLVDLLVSNEAA